MQYFVYILFSKSADKYYVGHTQDMEDRLYRHNNSGSKSTKSHHDWVLVYFEEFQTRSDAMLRERYIKSRKSKDFIQKLITSAG